MKNTNFKLTYLEAKIEILAFKVNDIITTSPPKDEENENGDSDIAGWT